MIGQFTRNVFGMIIGLALVMAGGLSPFIAQAGDLEPPGPPAPTMHTLEQTPPSWDQILPAAERFTLVMGGAAVRDNETGLVWEQSPDSDDNPGDGREWYSAIIHCAQRTVGGRKGWHLPMREQLASLVDSSNTSPALPTGHPFNNVPSSISSIYWSATTDAGFPSRGWLVNFSTGLVFTRSKAETHFVWCVRGGQTFDGQDNQRVIDALTP